MTGYWEVVLYVIIRRKILSSIAIELYRRIRGTNRRPPWCVVEWVPMWI